MAAVDALVSARLRGEAKSVFSQAGCNQLRR
jgi:hypothetical protein